MADPTVPHPESIAAAEAELRACLAHADAVSQRIIDRRGTAPNQQAKRRDLLTLRLRIAECVLLLNP